MLNNFFNKLGDRTSLITFFCLTFLLLISFALREPDLNKSTAAHNIEASWHVLMTVTAMSENKASDYWLLPTVTLGGERNKNIHWGPTKPTASGDYVYASFTPLGFLLPYLWFESFDLQPTIKNLAHFNFFIHFLATILLYFLLVDLLKWSGINPSIAQFSALGGVLIGIFSREALLSHGIVYWSHSLQQIVLIACIYLFFKFITLKEKAPSYIWISLVVLTSVGAYLEWTGFVFAISLSAVLWLARSDNMLQNKRVALYLLCFSFLAGLFILVHYSLAIGFDTAINLFAERFLGRSAGHGNPIKLAAGYLISYNLFLLLIVGLLVSRVLSNFPVNKQSKYELYLVFIVACCPLLENLIMLQHATQFGFDRLKFIIPASMLIAFGLAYSGTKKRAKFLVALFFTSFISYGIYKFILNIDDSSWSDIDASNRALAANISEYTDINCAVVAINTNTTGYDVLLFHRNIYGNRKLEDISNLIKSTSACSGVYLSGSRVFTDLPKYSMAIIQYPDGSIKSIPAN